MKNVTGIVTTQGNVNASNAVECQIDPGAMGIVMEILSKMYSDGYLAVLREYSCNARDAHISMGQQAPVEVTLPTVLQPSLLIRDFGPGLDQDGLIRVFGTYGASTKRDTNDQVGAFGIGSKSAFTMGQQFVVTGIKDCVKTVALFALNESNVGTINILQEQETTEPNGVLVSLAVEDPERMAATAAKFFSTWDKSTVLVNGVAPEVVWDKGYAFNDEVHVIPDAEGDVMVVMGAVGYPVRTAILHKVASVLRKDERPGAAFATALASWGADNDVFLTVPIGGVDIAPSREDLRDTNRTVEALGAIFDRVADEILDRVRSDVDKATTWVEAYRAWKTSTATLEGFPAKFEQVTWQGHKFFEVNVDLRVLYLKTKSYRATRKTLHHDAKFHMSLERLDKTLVITDVSLADVNAVSRSAKRFIEGNEQGYEWLLLSPATAASYSWFTYGVDGGAATMTLTEFKEVMKGMRKAAGPRMVNEPSYDQVPGKASKTASERTPLSEIVEDGRDILLFHETSTIVPSSMLEKALEGDYQLVVLTPTQTEAALARRLPEDMEIVGGRKVCRDLAVEYVEAADAKIQEVLKARALKSAYYSADWDEALNVYGARRDEILHDEFLAGLTAYEAAVKAADVTIDGMETVEAIARWLGRALVDSEDVEIEVPDVDETYPLLQHWSGNRTWYSNSDPAVQAETQRLTTHGIAYLNGLALSE